MVILESGKWIGPPSWDCFAVILVGQNHFSTTRMSRMNSARTPILELIGKNTYLRISVELDVKKVELKLY